MRVKRTTRGRFLRLSSALLLLSLAACARLALADETNLSALLAERLALMPAVAAAKFATGQPVQDPVRETQVLLEVRLAALREGLEPDAAAALFETQMAAARQVQTYWIERWRSGVEAAPPPPDLVGSVRPALSALTTDILKAAARVARGDAAAWPGPGPDPLDAVIGLQAASRAASAAAVAELRVYPHRLAQVQNARVLRVGMTGDYAPFTVQDGSGAWSGIDVDLAQDLAQAVGAEVVFVPTRWTTLERDLADGAFDIAMGGVSRTLERQRQGLQTRPYYADGKTPIVRCADQSRFSDFAAIDQPGVRVVVNPGGTNQRFADSTIRQAQIRVHPDNRTVFEEIAAGRADVMFTDRIEVELVSRRLPALCPALATDLTYQEKSYLLPQDPVWLAFVDTWLSLRLADGVVEARFAAHDSRWRSPRGRGAERRRLD